MRLFNGKFKITRHCCSHVSVSLTNSLIFIIELVILGSRSETGEAPQAAHYKTHSVFHKVMFQLEHRAEILIQNKKQNKQNKLKRKNSTNETQEKCFFRLQLDE